VPSVTPDDGVFPETSAAFLPTKLLVAEVALLPFGTATHLVRRDEHAFHATMIAAEGEDLPDVPAGQSSLERLSDALDDALP